MIYSAVSIYCGSHHFVEFNLMKTTRIRAIHEESLEVFRIKAVL